jgi:predicted transcriptional regulator
MNEAQTRDIISIEEIAEYLQLTVWDWLAVLIALLSFCIACLSLFYAIKTLKKK